MRLWIDQMAPPAAGRMRQNRCIVTVSWESYIRALRRQGYLTLRDLMYKLLAMLSLVASTASAQTQIGTYTPPTVPPFGAATGPFSTNSVGQGFFAPTGALTLMSLTYGLASIGNNPGGGPSSISIYTFDGTVPTGPALFTQGYINPTVSGFSSVTINPFIPVVAGERYIALVSTTVNDSRMEANIFEIQDSAANTTGDVFYLCFAGTTTCAVRDPGYVAAFQASFSTSVTAVPEPSTFALGAVGLAAIAFIRRRRTA